MPFEVGDIARYIHPSEAEEEQISFFSYHYRREYMDGKLVLILKTSFASHRDSAENEKSHDYYCYVDGDRMWINDAVLHEVKDENKKSNI